MLVGDHYQLPPLVQNREARCVWGGVCVCVSEGVGGKREEKEGKGREGGREEEEREGGERETGEGKGREGEMDGEREEMEGGRGERLSGYKPILCILRRGVTILTINHFLFLPQGQRAGS